MPGAPSHAYAYEGRVYLNVTNRCPTACSFCAKVPWRLEYRGANLALPAEPDAGELWVAALSLMAELRAKDVVFCGFGEPTERLDVLLDVARAIRVSNPEVRLRLNTVGLGSLINGRDVSSELRAVLHEVSVSLNAPASAQWRELHRPKPQYAERGFAAVCEFIRACARSGLRTCATAIELPGVDLVAVEALARSLGARFRLRPRLAGYPSS